MEEESKTNKTISCNCAGCNQGVWNGTGIIWWCWRHKEQNDKKEIYKEILG